MMLSSWSCTLWRRMSTSSSVSAAAAMVRRVQFQSRALVVFPCPRLQSQRFTDTQEAFRNKQTHKSRPRAPKTLQNFKTTKTSKTKQTHTKTEELQRFTGSLCIIYPSTLLSPLDTPRSSSMAAKVVSGLVCARLILASHRVTSWGGQAQCQVTVS